MDLESNLKGKLNISDVDIVVPDTVVKEIISQLESITSGFVSGVLEPYSGYIENYYTTSGLAVVAQMVSSTNASEYDIQQDLGKKGYKYSKFSLDLVAKKFPYYKYRVLFLGYDVGGYPVKVVIEKSIADSIASPTYTRIVKTRKELTELINRILSSSRVVEIMQGLINASVIEQSKTDQATEEAKLDFDHNISDTQAINNEESLESFETNPKENEE